MVKYKNCVLNLAPRLSGSTQNFLAEISDRLFQPFSQRHLGQPSPQLLRARNVGPPLFGIVLRQWLEYDFAPRASDTNDFARELQHVQFMRIAEVHRQGSVAHHQPVNALDQVRTVTKTAR